MDRRKSPSRAGFTLVEVLVAILIIATLVAILLPAVRGAFRRAKEAQVTAEMNNLATALASFKNTYGDYPPSRIILCEAGYNSLSGLTGRCAERRRHDMTYQQLIQRSRLYLRRFWPRVDFDSAPASTASGQFNDFNGDGAIKRLRTSSPVRNAWSSSWAASRSLPVPVAEPRPTERADSASCQPPVH